jgi:hypothetical protein
VDRIELRVNGLVVYESGTVPPPPPPPPVDPVKPEPAKPVVPAGPNPFIAWRAQGLELDYISMWRLNRALSPEEEEQAYAAGYPRPNAPAGGPGVNRDTFVLSSDNGFLVHPHVNPGDPNTFYFPQGSGKHLRIFGVGGDEIHTVNGKPYDSGFIPAPYGGAITLSVTGVGTGGRIWLGVQLV